MTLQDEPVKHRPYPRKDRRRWCKGKAGREHDYRQGETFEELVQATGTRQTKSHFRCSRCSRIEYPPRLLAEAPMTRDEWLYLWHCGGVRVMHATDTQLEIPDTGSK